MIRGAGFVPRLADRLRAFKPVVSTAPKRSAIAIVLRIVGCPHESYRTVHGDFLRSRAALESMADTTEVLYIKRAANPNDPWSGNVAFPGGRRDAIDVDDHATAVRECLEETGLDLKHFLYLGRLDDRSVTARGATRQGFVVCPFVFIQPGPETPPLTLQASEVAAAQWTAFSQLTVDQASDAGTVDVASPPESCCLLLLPGRP
jgi:8-oxo-dGTP pyrophosphatase MutT (NUDIX family)